MVNIIEAGGAELVAKFCYKQFSRNKRGPSSAGYFDLRGYAKAIGLTPADTEELNEVYANAKHFSQVSEESLPGAGEKARDAKHRFRELAGVDFSAVTDATHNTNFVRDPRNDADWPKY